MLYIDGQQIWTLGYFFFHFDDLFKKILLLIEQVRQDWHSFLWTETISTLHIVFPRFHVDLRNILAFGEKIHGNEVEGTLGKRPDIVRAVTQNPRKSDLFYLLQLLLGKTILVFEPEHGHVEKVQVFFVNTYQWSKIY